MFTVMFVNFPFVNFPLVTSRTPRTTLQEESLAGVVHVASGTVSLMVKYGEIVLLRGGPDEASANDGSASVGVSVMVSTRIEVPLVEDGVMTTS